MSATREELRAFFQEIEGHISKHFVSADGRTILHALIKKTPLPADIPSDLDFLTKYFRAILRDKTNPKRLFLRYAIDLELIAHREKISMGNRLAEKIRAKLFDDDICLSFRDIELDDLTIKQTDGFLDILKYLPIQQLSFHDCTLPEKNSAEHLKEFFQILKSHRTLKMLALSKDSLHLFDKQSQVNLFEMIECANIHALDLSNNWFGSSSFDFQGFCNAFQRSKTINLDLTYTVGLMLSGAKRLALLNAFLHNFYCQDIKGLSATFTAKENQELETALQRNQRWYQVKLEAKAINEMLRKNLKDDSAQLDEMLVQRIEMFRQQLKQVKKMLQPYASEAIMIELLAIKNKYMFLVGRCFKKHFMFEQAVQYFLRVSAQSTHYVDARSKAFRLTYDGHYEKKDKGYASLIAFIDALPCCLNQNNHFIVNEFKKKKLDMFDLLLVLATGAKRKVGEPIEAKINMSNRQLLLRYVLVRGLCTSMAEHLPNQSALFQSRNDRLVSSFLALPRLFDDMKAFSVDFEDVWQKALAIVNGSSDATLKVLFKAAEAFAQQTKELTLDNVSSSSKPNI